MIVADASALLAIYRSEPERDRFVRALRDSPPAVMSPVNLWETLVRAEAIDGATGRSEVENIVANFEIEIIPVDVQIARLAADAFERFRGRPARLNLGDCFAYALAKQCSAALLFKGDDFTHTDIERA
jgi:ribonuclease VapC